MNSKKITTIVAGLRVGLIAILAAFFLACPDARAQWLNLSTGPYNRDQGGHFQACMDSYGAYPGYIRFSGWVWNRDTREQISIIVNRPGGYDYYCDLHYRWDVCNAWGLSHSLNTAFDVYVPCKAGTYGSSMNFYALNQARNTPYPIWTFTCYVPKPTATFDKQGGTGGTDNVLVDYSVANPTITPPTRAGGYVFDGYYTGTNGTGTKYYNANGTSAANWNECGGKTLYAKWLVARNENTGAGYVSVQDAINAASNGQTVKVLVNSTGNFSNSKTLTLDLNGCVLSANNSGRVLTNTGVLTIKDSNPNAVHYYTVSSNGYWIWNDNSSANATDFETLTARPADNSIIALKGGAITAGCSNAASGIYSNGGSAKLILQGGNIVGNRTYEGTTAIYWGGGVKVDNGTCEMSGGNIVGNAIRSLGKGAGIDCNRGTFTMTGGLIGFNYAKESGAGVLSRGSSTVTMTGGSIRYNKGEWATGIGLRCDDDGTQTLKLGGTAVVTDNGNGTSVSNVQLCGTNTITILTGDDAPREGMKIGVTATAPTPTKNVTLSGECTDDVLKYFSSDNAKYVIEFISSSAKLELCGHRLYLNPKGAACSKEYVRVIEGQDCPTLPSLTKDDGTYSPGWFTIDQTAEADAIPADDKKVATGKTVTLEQGGTVYAWWKNIATEDHTDPNSAKETISKETVTNDDVIYTLNQAEKSNDVNNITVFDMSESEEVENVEDVVNMIRNSPKSTPNTLIYLPENTEVSSANSENVIIKKTSGDNTSYTCANFSATDGTPVSVPHAFTADAATYTRLQSSRWGTICVPFELTSNDRIQFYTSGTSYGDKLVLEKAATVAAGKPAIYCIGGIEGSNKDDFDITYYAKSVIAEGASESGNTQTIKLVGTFKELVIDDSNAGTLGSGCDIYYYLENNFYKRASGQTVTIPALRAYILIEKKAE